MILGFLSVNPETEGEYLFVGNDNLLLLNYVKDGRFGGSYLSAASVTSVLCTTAGTFVAGSTSTWTFKTGTAGRYEGILEDAAALVVGKRYKLKVDVSASTDLVGYFEKILVARDRVGN